MNRQTLICLVLSLTLIGGTAGVLARVHSNQKLAPPGVATHPLPGSIRLHADLPEHVLDYSSKELETEEVAYAVLPEDTSFGRRRYVANDDFFLELRVVLMGRDRTSLHRPQFCLTGQGWTINESLSRETTVRIEQPIPYDLPVLALAANKSFNVDGQNKLYSGVYVYWYVADDAVSAGALGIQRMWSMASALARTGVLQRWAYVSCFAPCAPGQEPATLERLKKFIAAAVPQFQLYPRSPGKLGFQAQPLPSLAGTEGVASLGAAFPQRLDTY